MHTALQHQRVIVYSQLVYVQVHLNVHVCMMQMYSSHVHLVP
jgi:hypothetical protein